MEYKEYYGVKIKTDHVSYELACDVAYVLNIKELRHLLKIVRNDTSDKKIMISALSAMIDGLKSRNNFSATDPYFSKRMNVLNNELRKANA